MGRVYDSMKENKRLQLSASCFAQMKESLYSYQEPFHTIPSPVLGYTLSPRSKQTLRPLLIYGCLVTTTRHVNHNSYSSKLRICLYWEKNIKGPESTAEESSVTVTLVFVELHNVIITVSVTFVIRIDGSRGFTPKNPCLQISSPLLLAGEIDYHCLP